MTTARWDRIKEIFDSALECPQDERSSYVARVCGEDHSLREEVESLLSGSEGEESYMRRLQMAVFDGPAAAMPKRSLAVGEILSERFVIRQFIGEGGMGEVYAAEDIDLGINVAIKTIRQETATDQGVLARFRQELHFTRRITHPNICRVFDSAHHLVPGVPESGERNITYLTMELVEGETLADRLRRGRMTADEALPLIQQMVAGLEAAHAAG